MVGDGPQSVQHHDIRPSFLTLLQVLQGQHVLAISLSYSQTQPQPQPLTSDGGGLGKLARSWRHLEQMGSEGWGGGDGGSKGEGRRERVCERVLLTMWLTSGIRQPPSRVAG